MKTQVKLKCLCMNIQFKYTDDDFVKELKSLELEEIEI